MQGYFNVIVLLLEKNLLEEKKILENTALRGNKVLSNNLSHTFWDRGAYRRNNELIKI